MAQSAYEKDRMIPLSLGVTAMGRDLLAQDYMLKQLTASLIYPQKTLGKMFWAKVYAKAKEIYGTTQIPVNTFNKVWIVPQRVGIYEHGQTAFIVDGHLKVMLEVDYLSMTKHNAISNSLNVNETNQSQVNQLGSQIIRTIILPEIEKEVNDGKNFATLRQIFYAQALAVWFKHNLKQALLNQVYANKSTVKGIDQNDIATNEVIYRQYLRAYKKGVFNFIKEDIDPVTQEVLPRKYFSGGWDGMEMYESEYKASQLPDGAMSTEQNYFDVTTFAAGKANAAAVASQVEKLTRTTKDEAMMTPELVARLQSDLMSGDSVRILSATREIGNPENYRDPNGNYMIDDMLHGMEALAHLLSHEIPAVGSVARQGLEGLLNAGGMELLERITPSSTSADERIARLQRDISSGDPVRIMSATNEIGNPETYREPDGGYNIKDMSHGVEALVHISGENNRDVRVAAARGINALSIAGGVRLFERMILHLTREDESEVLSAIVFLSIPEHYTGTDRIEDMKYVLEQFVPLLEDHRQIIRPEVARGVAALSNAGGLRVFKQAGRYVVISITDLSKGKGLDEAMMSTRRQFLVRTLTTFGFATAVVKANAQSIQSVIFKGKGKFELKVRDIFEVDGFRIYDDKLGKMVEVKKVKVTGIKELLYGEVEITKEYLDKDGKLINSPIHTSRHMPARQRAPSWTRKSPKEVEFKDITIKIGDVFNYKYEGPFGNIITTKVKVDSFIESEDNYGHPQDTMTLVDISSDLKGQKYAIAMDQEADHPKDITKDKAALAQPLGGIDLSQQDAAMHISKDANGGVIINVDPSLIATVEHDGLSEVDPVIIDIQPASAQSIFGVSVLAH